MANGPYYTSKYETGLLYVDSDNHRVLVKDTASTAEEYLEYDLLVGADGVRSMVMSINPIVIVRYHNMPYIGVSNILVVILLISR